MAPLLQLVFILVVGTVCQLIGWLTKLPSILLLLVAGIASGPVLGIISPDTLLGPVLMPFVELAVAVILFEGGLSLKKTELGQVGSIVLRLIVIATLLTWVMLAFLAYKVLHLSLPVSALFGSILVISGPTVVIPLLRLIRARAPVEQILRWEGILIDPIGVILAVLVAEVCEVGVGLASYGHIAWGIIFALSIGISFGWLGAQILKLTVGQHRVPDQFIVPLTLATLFSLVILSNTLHEQSGLLTSTVMGLLVARSQSAWVQTIEDFIGHTQRMFIGVLFIVLAARLDSNHLQHFDWYLCVFILIAVVVVRPLSVIVATLGTTLKMREKLAVAALAPRGIVSAALASSLGASLASAGIAGIESIVPYTFATIIGTVAIYGAFSPLLFKLCGVRQIANEGVLFVGGGKVAIAIAKILKNQGFRVLLVDTNQLNIRRVNAEKLESYHGSILSDGVLEDFDFEGLGNLLSFTPNDEANSLAAVEFRQVFGAKHVFQLSSPLAESSRAAGRIFAQQDLTWEKFEELWLQGYRPFIREVSKEGSPSSALPDGSSPEYLLAEIENKKLYIAAQDKLVRASRPEMQIVFGRSPLGAATKDV